MRKKVLLWAMAFLILISATVAVPNFAIKARALRPEVEGYYVDDPTCKGSGFRCYESEENLCLCRDASSGECC